MTLSFGRIVKAEQLAGSESLTLELEARTLPRGQLVRREVLEAAERAQGILNAAEERAAQIVAEAERAAAELCLRAEAEGRANAAAQIAARALALNHHEQRADERALDRNVALARLLAERLLGQNLTLAPELVVALARQALSEARGARRITLVAHPDDAALLEKSLPALGLEPSAARVVADGKRARGNLRIETEIGVLDAELAPQLARLALKLRESLAHDR
jgi:flagellar biosynthesis/type III secretory pathway protein FliH